MNNVRKSPEKRTLIPSLKNKRDQTRSHWAGIGFRREDDTVTVSKVAEQRHRNKLPASAIKQAIMNTNIMASVWRNPPFFKLVTAKVTSERVLEAKHWWRAHLSNDIIWWCVHVSLVKYSCFLFLVLQSFKKQIKPNKKQTKKERVEILPPYQHLFKLVDISCNSVIAPMTQLCIHC